jgi:DNA-directed RNA polymerase specialized sigma24 family protein
MGDRPKESSQPCREVGDRVPPIEAVLDRLGSRLARICGGFKIARQDVEDIQQEALLSLVAKWDEIQDPIGWLIGTVGYLCLQHLRSQRRQQQWVLTVEAKQLERIAAAATEELRDRRLDLTRLARALPRRQQRVLRCYCLGLLNDETAELVGMGHSNSVTKDRRRAVLRLRALARARPRRR